MSNETKLKLAFVCLYTACPPTSGAARVTYDCARLTPADCLLVQLGDADSTERVEGMTVVTIKCNTSSRMQKLLAMPQVIARICRHLKAFKPTHVVLEGASWAVYLTMLAVVIRLALRNAKIVYHAHNVEYLLRLGREKRYIIALTRSAEKYLFSRCDFSFSVSNEDCKKIDELYGVKPGLLPNGVDCSSLAPLLRQAHITQQPLGLNGDAILFMGFYAYPPNREAIQFLVERVLPALRSQRPEVQLVVTGGEVPVSYPWLIAPGVLPRRELESVLSVARVGVAPIFSGSGTRLKILEYMASGLPVVTTRKGAEGLDTEDGKHVLYAETPIEFQQAILRLLDDRVLAERLSSEASRFVQSRYDWHTLLQRFATQLKESLTAAI
jgi:glycosyltransferase involved in cell wall biosynthesis